MKNFMQLMVHTSKTRPQKQSIFAAMKLIPLIASFVLYPSLAKATVINKAPIIQQLQDELSPRLSRGGLISLDTPPRWSLFDAPTPGAVVDVQTAQDVATTVYTFQ